ncbi:hypothetical protein [Paramagnetospirillum marisnigri]|uniref:hypothetical protein n=1 Tax=Paramagnetospirillum marisnigri TaxID=1285242 RepID=UPI000ADEA66C|nr:hypothetical protein [Paramagnetospirillum marisnigri]
MIKNIKNAIIFVISLFAGCANHAIAAEFSYTSANAFGEGRIDGESLLISSSINSGDTVRLKNFILSDTKRYLETNRRIILSSTGGDISEALKIADFIQGTYSTVFVGKATGRCLSACFFMYLSAPTRMASLGSIGIHRPYLRKDIVSKMSPGEAMAEQKKAISYTRDRLTELGVPAQLIDKMISHSSDELYILTEAEILIDIGHYSNWYEQYLISRCNLRKHDVNSYFQPKKDSRAYGNSILATKIVDAEKCGHKLSAAEYITYLQRFLSE